MLIDTNPPHPGPSYRPASAIRCHVVQLAPVGMTAGSRRIELRFGATNSDPDKAPYPNLLKGLEIVRPDHVWCGDGRLFGRLVNASLDVTHHQGWVSSPWRPGEPSLPRLVSFQGT